MKECTTYEVNIYVGLKDLATNHQYTTDDVIHVCRGYCDKVNLCVSVFPCDYVYVNGSEFGCMVKLIQYPRFKAHVDEIDNKAIELAKLLKRSFKQERMSVQFPNRTVMLEEHE